MQQSTFPLHCHNSTQQRNNSHSHWKYEMKLCHDILPGFTEHSPELALPPPAGAPAPCSCPHSTVTTAPLKERDHRNVQGSSQALLREPARTVYQVLVIHCSVSSLYLWSVNIIVGLYLWKYKKHQFELSTYLLALSIIAFLWWVFSLDCEYLHWVLLSGFKWYEWISVCLYTNNLAMILIHQRLQALCDTIVDGKSVAKSIEWAALWWHHLVAQWRPLKM